ncbi:MAG: protein phosphatase CheZ [Colwellia sp.]
MSVATMNQISLDQAKLLVELLEADKQEEADKIIDNIQSSSHSELFAEIGKLTRQLHESMSNFHLDSRLNDLATADIPDAKERLNYVITRTEEAANKTMDAVESTLPMLNNLSGQVSRITPAWTELMDNDLKVNDFKVLCADLDTLLSDTNKDTKKIHDLMNEVLMAQDFQDLTGQVIRQVIDLVREVEESLINMLTVFGISPEQNASEVSKRKVGDNLVEGPIMDAENRDDVVADQDDVDDLLSSLGF